MCVLWVHCIAPVYREAAKALSALICAGVYACAASVTGKRLPGLGLVGVYLPRANFEVVLPAVFDKADYVFVGIAQEKADFVWKLTSAGAIAAGTGLASVVCSPGISSWTILQATCQLIEACLKIADAIPFASKRTRCASIEKIGCKFAGAVHVDEGSAALPGQNADRDPGA